MERELLIAAGPGEWRAALLEAAVPVELMVERGERSEAGSIHLGRVCRLVPALDAALVDIGGERPAFLPQREVVPRGSRLNEGQRVLVQVRREPQDGKAARVTMAVRPRSRHLEQITDGAEGLAQRWRNILDRASLIEPPARLDPVPTFAAALASALPGTAARVGVDDPGAVPETRAAFPGAAVAHRPQAEWPIDLDALFDQALSETVALPGSGAIHFETTRAGMLIDVDSGIPEAGSPQRTGIETNLAAAVTIARQVRLRNLGGGIVIDFIGLDNRASREEVRAALAEALAGDPAMPQILGWTRLGHFELVRPRRGRPLHEALVERRRGGALVKTGITIAFEALRALRRQARAQPGRQWQLVVAPEVAAVLTGGLAGAVREAERRFAREIAITADPALGRERFQIAPR